ncbi:hypothetical protein AVEN_106983-1 [Araneus ventricosus]|uniref:Uncharacterized protein n=1 Tax=Araneus ventricosus TaxID=182803 RepID=A0A4Y2J8A8_ARAVE|nr:hypothetical protein AVEN_106983-1 [Araneus ventricosus]
MVSASASEPADRELYPGCSHSASAINCKASLLQFRPMVTLKLAANLFHSCRVKLASFLQTKIAIWEVTPCPRRQWSVSISTQRRLEILYESHNFICIFNYISST